MAAVLIHRQSEDKFEIEIFRDDNSLKESMSKYQERELFLMRNVDRTAIRQIERYFKRRLNDTYFELLKTDSSEEAKIRKLYEVRTMR